MGGLVGMEQDLLPDWSFHVGGVGVPYVPGRGWGVPFPSPHTSENITFFDSSYLAGNKQIKSCFKTPYSVK